jgi:pimeloyl-ACP methyl ester carboxylesterase
MRAVVAMVFLVGCATTLEARRTDTERRLARIEGHDSVKASIRWPYDVARLIAAGIRRPGTNDFGLRDDGTQRFDLDKELRDSQELLAALEAGRDPLVRARGDHERHYHFVEANEIMPYRIYVPTTWDGRSKLRMLLVLHGSTRDHDYYFDRDGGMLPRLAERDGWLVVCPMGYRPNNGYTGLGETDVMNVFDLVTREYPVDLDRVYLFGHSAGGTGGWRLGTKYAEKFAGIAISAAGTQPDNFPFERLRGKSLMVIVGTKDAPKTVAAARAMAAALKDHGLDPHFQEIEGATHVTVVGLAEPRVFEFFGNNAVGKGL